jgi:hypothetical protein
MKHILLLFAFAALCSTHAAEADFKSFFMHPNARIIAKIGTVNSKCVPYKNHSNPKTPGELPSFQSGLGTSGNELSGFAVYWSFVKKTEYGDLYLFVLKKDDVLVKAFPALYTGSTVIAYEHDGIQVTIEPFTDED